MGFLRSVMDATGRSLDNRLSMRQAFAEDMSCNLQVIDANDAS
jgi:hypothetical protein